MGVRVGAPFVGGGEAGHRVEAGRERLEAGHGEGVVWCSRTKAHSRRLRVLDVAEGGPGDGAHAADAKPAREHPAYQTLRKKLLHEIVAKDASEEDMADIFADATREQSGSQHKHVLKAVIADLKIELELQPEA